MTLNLESLEGSCLSALDLSGKILSNLAECSKQENQGIDKLLESILSNTCWVAFDEKGSIMSCVRFRLKPAELYLFDIHIFDPYKSRGLGRGLMKYMEETARAAGKKYLRLRCRNYSKANNFYIKCGYASVGSDGNFIRYQKVLFPESGRNMGGDGGACPAD